MIVIRMQGCGWCWDSHRYTVSMITVPASSAFVHIASKLVYICMLLRTCNCMWVLVYAVFSFANTSPLLLGKKCHASGT